MSNTEPPNKAGTARTPTNARKRNLLQRLEDLDEQYKHDKKVLDGQAAAIKQQFIAKPPIRQK
jgi:hypothetical protein